MAFSATNTKVSYVVSDETPEGVINRVRLWLEDRPWTTSTFLAPLSKDPAITGFIHPRDMYWSGLGCLINLALSVLTVGAWLVVAIAYYIVAAVMNRPTLVVRAFYGGENEVRLQVQAGRISHKREPEYLAEIDNWLKSELNAEKLAGS